MLLCEIAPDIFDPVKGIGAVPNNQSVDYFGFIAYMKPSTFLSLAKPLSRDRAESVEGIKAAIEKGVRLGPPFLIIDFNEAVNKPGVVRGHEGRNRMYAIMELYGDYEVPVHVFMYGETRARHLNADNINYMNSVLVDERGNRVSGPFWNKVIHTP